MDKLTLDILQLQISHEKEIRETKEKAADLALELAFKELERRLDVLNHAHEASLQDRSMFVQIPTYNAKMDPLMDRVNQLENFRTRIEEGNNIRTKEEARRQWQIGISLTVVFSIITIFMRFYKGGP